MIFVRTLNKKEIKIFVHIFSPKYPQNTPETIIIYPLSDESASESICFYSVMFKLTVSINYLKIHSYVKKEMSRRSIRAFLGAFQPPLFIISGHFFSSNLEESFTL